MPGAKYDATVGAVIQIITEKAQGEGLSGTLHAGSKRSERWSAEEFVSLNYRHKVWDIFGSAYLIQRRRQIDMKADQQLSVADAVHGGGLPRRGKREIRTIGSGWWHKLQSEREYFSRCAICIQSFDLEKRYAQQYQPCRE